MLGYLSYPSDTALSSIRIPVPKYAFCLSVRSSFYKRQAPVDLATFSSFVRKRSSAVSGGEGDLPSSFSGFYGKRDGGAGQAVPKTFSSFYKRAAGDGGGGVPSSFSSYYGRIRDPTAKS